MDAVEDAYRRGWEAGNEEAEALEAELKRVKAVRGPWAVLLILLGSALYMATVADPLAGLGVLLFAAGCLLRRV